MLTFSVPVAENVSDMPCNHVRRNLESNTYRIGNTLRTATTKGQQLTILHVY